MAQDAANIRTLRVLAIFRIACLNSEPTKPTEIYHPPLVDAALALAAQILCEAEFNARTPKGNPV